MTPVTAAESAAFDLVVVGDANPDVVLHDVPASLAFGQAERVVGRAVLTLGGSGAITAHAAARLGLRTAFVGLLGDDDAGRLTIARLRRAGIDVRNLVTRPALATALTVVLVRPDGDRAILTGRGSLPELAAADVDPELLTSARHVHVSSLFLQPALQEGLHELLAVARGAGATTSLDTNDDPSGRWRVDLERLLPYVDFLLPNAREALGLAGASSRGDVVAAARELSRHGPTVVVKCGAQGALLVDGPDVLRADLRRTAVSTVDTVGAGDAFDAGFVAGLLDGLSMVDALRLAAATGTLSTRAAGGVDGQPDRAEARLLADAVVVTAGVE